MAKVTYTLLDRPLGSITENEKYSEADLNLIDNYEINKKWNFNTHFIETHFYSVYNTKLLSVYDYELPAEVVVDNTGVEDTDVSQLTLKPVDVAIEYGFVQTDVAMVFHFLNDLYTDDKEKQDFYIHDISQDRRELLLYSDKVETNYLINRTEDLVNNLKSKKYFEEFWVNCGDNDLFIATNIDLYELDDKFAIAVKLYEPLPKDYKEKSIVQLVEKISDSIVVQVEPEVEPEIAVRPKLRRANFSVKVDKPNAKETEYFNYDELFSYTNTNSNRELHSLINERSVSLNIEHSKYEDFIHFSSAEERVKNFKYKLQLIESYQTSLDTVTGLSNITNIAGSNTRYNRLIKGIVENFDHYERHLYYDSGSSSWPKQTTSKPHINFSSTSSEATNWYNNQIITASNFDAQNYDVLANTLPDYIGDDSANNPGVIFTHMLGQHFDNLWIYTKAITDKYNADNRGNIGISKDLVKEAIRSLGVKIYNSEEGSQNLFKYLIADSYDSGSQLEVINEFKTVPGLSPDAQPISRKEYEGEVYKRIYHNIPFLTKSKGTHRGIRALINCFGIPADTLKIKQYGGTDVDSGQFFNYDVHSTNPGAKIRTENRVSGSVNKLLSSDTGIQKKENTLTQDIHRVEVGFSPTDSIDGYVKANVGENFSIDEFLGDPRNEGQLAYDGLTKFENSIIGGLERYQLNDFIRALKFYDNTLFKMIKDFLPARTTADTGIIIKPGLLSRSKTKTPEMSGTRPEHEGTIDTAFTTGSDGGAYNTPQFVTIESHQKEIEARWRPGRVGGVSNLSFDLNRIANGNADPGEIRVNGTELHHPDGTLYKFPDSTYEVLTPYEGVGGSHFDFYLMFTSESVTNRFPSLSGFSVATKAHPHIIPVDYYAPGNTWTVRDNNAATTASFTPLANDLILASVGLIPGSGNLEEFHSFLKSYSGVHSDIKTTFYREDVNTMIGNSYKLIDDESPKLNGELSGSYLEITDGELNSLNNFKQVNAPILNYDITKVASDSGVYTPFTLHPTGQTTPGTACSLLSSDGITFYHEGSGALPQVNDVVYTDSGGNNLLVGGTNYYYLGTQPGALSQASPQAVRINNSGVVTDILDCSQYDTTPPSPPTAAYRTTVITSVNENVVPYKIYGAELYSTAHVTASLDSNNIVNSTLTMGSSTDKTGYINLSSLPDTTTGTGIILNVRLADAFGNLSGEATTATNTGDHGRTIYKSTVIPSGYSVRFVTGFNSTTNQTFNTNGFFALYLEGIPSGNYTATLTLSSTGGGYPDISTQAVGNGNTTAHMYRFSSQHGLSNGTITAALTLQDASGNVGGTVSDTLTYSQASGTLSPSTISSSAYGQTHWISIMGTTGPWSLTSSSSWITLNTSSGTSNQSVSISTSSNSGSTRSGWITLYVNGTNVDFTSISQAGSGNCVDPETDISISNGSTLKAKDIKTGDVVLTKHEHSLEVLHCIVTKAQTHNESDKLKLIFEDSELICSENHRVYVDNKTSFIAAKKLIAGDILSGKKLIDIEDEAIGPVVEISVEKAHTYIANGILSHNVKNYQ